MASMLLRLDATKHVELPFLRRFSKDLKDYAKEKYNRDLYLVGEWFGAGFPSNVYGGDNKYRHYDIVVPTHNLEITHIQIQHLT